MENINEYINLFCKKYISWQRQFVCRFILFNTINFAFANWFHIFVIVYILYSIYILIYKKKLKEKI